jgi:hypothetical protein
MKQFILPVAAILFILNMTAQTLPVKLYEFTGTNGISAGFDGKPGKELNTFQVPADANGLRMYIKVPVTDVKKADAQYHVQLMVTANNKDNPLNIHNQYWNPLRQATTLVTDCFFPPGDFTIILVDKDNPQKVFAKRDITVKGIQTKGSFVLNGFSYDRSKFKIWTCKSVDETNWKPIGQTGKITTGSCITFFFESLEKIKNPGTFRWKIYTVGDDGKETFVNQKDQNSKLGEFRRLYYEECDEFRTKGKYRVYFAVKNESEAYYGVIDKDYFAKADIIVE